MDDFGGRIQACRRPPGAAIGAEAVGGKQFVPALFTAGGGHCFHRDHTNHLFQRGNARLNLFQGVVLHPAHARARAALEQIRFVSPAQDGAYRVVDYQQFVDADAAFVAGMVAGVAACRPGDAVRQLRPAQSREALGVVRRDRLVGPADAELAKQALGENSRYRRCDQSIPECPDRASGPPPKYCRWCAAWKGPCARSARPSWRFRRSRDRGFPRS